MTEREFVEQQLEELPGNNGWFTDFSRSSQFFKEGLMPHLMMFQKGMQRFMIEMARENISKQEVKFRHGIAMQLGKNFGTKVRL